MEVELTISTYSLITLCIKTTKSFPLLILLGIFDYCIVLNYYTSSVLVAFSFIID